MIAGKHLPKIAAVLMAAAVLLCFAAMAFSQQLAQAAGGAGVTMEYEQELFDTDKPITVNILMDRTQWDEMLQNAIREEYCRCDVEINGTTYYRVGIRPKGNTSLTSIANDPDTDRFSFKLEFDQYVDGQTCCGLDKLILNSNYADATNMKEALVYDMYRYLGADASLYNYARVELNGEYWGVYLALEAVEDSFLLRNYGVKSGQLYKPDPMGMGGGRGGFSGERMDNSDMLEMLEQLRDSGEMPEAPAEGEPSEEGDNMPRGGNSFFGGKGGFSMSGGGADLNYTDGEADSYSAIWEGALGNVSKNDRRRVITALKNISEGVELETYMDVDNLLKYAAVHMFSVNEDSLSGMMSHNYYLYEYRGQLNLLPWDYNLALGGMGGGSASDMVNDPIDDIFTGTHFFDKLMEKEEYLARYHGYLSQLVSEYIDGGGFQAFYTRTRSFLDTLAASDPTAFYTEEEYRQAADVFYEAVQLRGRSVAGQVEGTVPSTGLAQQQDRSALVDASALDLSAMGTMNAGGFGGGPGRENADRAGKSDSSTLPQGGTASGGQGQESTGPEGFDPSQFAGRSPGGDFPGGELPEGFDPSRLAGGTSGGGFPDGEPPEGFDPSPFGVAAPGQAGENGGGQQASRAGEESNPQQETPGSENGGSGEQDQSGQDRQKPDKNFNFSRENGFESGSGDAGVRQKNLTVYGVCLALLIAALLFAGLYKRRSIRR